MDALIANADRIARVVYWTIGSIGWLIVAIGVIVAIKSMNAPADWDD